MMFVDTSGLLCVLNEKERSHADAALLIDDAVRAVTHSYVLAEFVALAHVRRLPRTNVLSLLADIHDDARFDVVYVDEDLHQAGFDRLVQYQDKVWSLCDAVSFVLMERLSLTEALATDHHFEQAGYRRLLTP